MLPCCGLVGLRGNFSGDRSGGGPSMSGISADCCSRAAAVEGSSSTNRSARSPVLFARLTSVLPDLMGALWGSGPYVGAGSESDVSLVDRKPNLLLEAHLDVLIGTSAIPFLPLPNDVDMRPDEKKGLEEAFL